MPLSEEFLAPFERVVLEAALRRLGFLERADKLTTGGLARDVALIDGFVDWYRSESPDNPDSVKLFEPNDGHTTIKGIRVYSPSYDAAPVPVRCPGHDDGTDCEDNSNYPACSDCEEECGCPKDSVKPVRIRFEATSLDDGDIFLHWLASNDVISDTDYQAGKWFPKNDVIDIPASRVAQVKGLPDTLDIEVEIWDDEAPQTLDEVIDEATAMGLHDDELPGVTTAQTFAEGVDAMDRALASRAEPWPKPDRGVRDQAVAYAREHNLRLPMEPELMDTLPLLAAIGQHRWGDTVARIETLLMAMSRDDRNDAIEALRSRFDDIYNRD